MTDYVYESSLGRHKDRYLVIQCPDNKNPHIESLNGLNNYRILRSYKIVDISENLFTPKINFCYRSISDRYRFLNVQIVLAY